MKLTLSSLASGFASIAKLNANFVLLVNELQNKVLYRDNPTGEPNQMENDLDMNLNAITNADAVHTVTLFVNGVEVTAEELVPVAASELANGSAASPSLYFTSDTDTGLYRAATNQVGIACGGAAAVVLTSSTASFSGTVAALYGSFSDVTLSDDLTVAGDSTLTNVSVSGTVSLPAFALANGTTCTTQASGDSSTKLASTAFVADAVASAGKLRQIKRFTSTSQAAPTPHIYARDGSIPQNTEGYEVFAEAFTPTAADSIIVVMATLYGNSSDNRPVVALFKDSAADATDVFPGGVNADTGYLVPIQVLYSEVAGSTTARTYRLHMAASGVAGGSVVYVNRGSTTTNPYGTNKVVSTLVIAEYAP